MQDFGEHELVIANAEFVTDQQRRWAGDSNVIDEHAILAVEIDDDEAGFCLVELGMTARNERPGQHDVCVGSAPDQQRALVQG